MQMNDLARRFDDDRAHLRGVAYRILGSTSDADDAVQEAWFRLQREDAGRIENLTGWLTTVVARVALDMLRARTSRKSREEVAAPEAPAPMTPEQETALAASVGNALLVVLAQLEPAERIAFVLHDSFGLPFDEIAGIVGRSVDATRQLASRARRRVQGAPAASPEVFTEQRTAIVAFLTALRAGDFDGLVAVLDPDVVVQAGDKTFRDAESWARGATQWSKAAGHVEAMLVDGNVGLVFAPRGTLMRVLRFDVAHGRIVRGEVVMEPERLAALELSLLPD